MLVGESMMIHFFAKPVNLNDDKHIYGNRQKVMYLKSICHWQIEKIGKHQEV